MKIAQFSRRNKRLNFVIHDKWPSMNHSDWERASEISRIMLYETKLKLRVFRNTLGVKAFINHKEIDV